jgi:hypothetical protein
VNGDDVAFLWKRFCTEHRRTNENGEKNSHLTVHGVLQMISQGNPASDSRIASGQSEPSFDLVQLPMTNMVMAVVVFFDES